jgi:DNA polymerase III epsilon subunit-like protein
MKNNVTDGLNKVFEVGTDLVEVEKENKKVDVPDEVDNDYKYARENLYGVIEKSTDALDNLIDLAKASEHPRAFEVVAQLTKTLVDANKDLLDIQKKVKDLKKEDKKENPKNVTNALFVGSTAELQKMISGRNDDV